MFLVRADFLSIGRLAQPIAGDPKFAFHGRLRQANSANGNIDRDELCLVFADNSLTCYVAGKRTPFVSWLNQTSPFASSNVVVVDMNGDGVHEILDCQAGAFYGINRTSHKFTKKPVNVAAGLKTLLAGLTAGVGSAVQIRAVQLKSGKAQVLVLFDTRKGTAQKLIVHTNGSNSTLQLDGAPVTVPITSLDRVSVARIRGRSTDDVVLYTPSTGTYRFCHFTKRDTAFECPAHARIDSDLSGAKGPNLELFWARISLRRGDDARRHDCLLYDPSSKLFYVAVAGAGHAAAPGTGPERNSRLARVAESARAGSFVWAYTQRALELEADPDQDGIDTIVELGVVPDVPLHTYGASPFAKDIFVEMDYMGNATNQTRTEYKMSDAAISIAVSSMAQKGINLHIFQDEAVPFKECLSYNTSAATELDWSRDYDIPYKSKHFTRARQGIFRYCLWGFQHDCPDTSSGIVRDMPGSDLIITLGSWDAGGGYTAPIMAGTFLHELGHTLGLTHGSVDDVHNKPNHISIMNYLYQVYGVMKDNKRQFLFSEISCADLNLASVNETAGIRCTGIADNAVYQTWFDMPFQWVKINQPADMNMDGILESSTAANFDPRVGTTGVLRGGQDEYARMTFSAGDLSAVSRVARAAAGMIMNLKPSGHGAASPTTQPGTPSNHLHTSTHTGNGNSHSGTTPMGPRPSSPNHATSTGATARFASINLSTDRKRKVQAHLQSSAAPVVASGTARRQKELTREDVRKMPAGLTKFVNFIPNWIQALDKSKPSTAGGNEADSNRFQVVPPTLVARSASKDSKIGFTPTVQKHSDSGSFHAHNVPVFAAAGFTDKGKLSEEAKSHSVKKLWLSVKNLFWGDTDADE